MNGSIGREVHIVGIDLWGLETKVFSDVTAELPSAASRLSVDSGKQPAIYFDIAPGVTIAIDSIYGNLNGTPPLGSCRFWLTLQQ